MATFDPTRLYSSLLNTGLQTKDNPLYQVIHDIIRTLASVNTQANVSTAASSGGPTTITNITQMIGIPGEDGSDGIDGAPGIQGLTGPQGLSGVDGVDGADGDDIFIRSNMSSSDLSDISNVALLNRDPQTFTGLNNTFTAYLRILAPPGNNATVLDLIPTGSNLNYIKYGTAAGNILQFFSYKTGVGDVGDFDGDGNFSIKKGTLGVGTLAIAQSAITTNSNITALVGAAYQFRMLGSLIAAANNDSLEAVRINPTYTSGAFTGVSAYGLRIFDVSGAATNYALNTGLGLVHFGGNTDTSGTFLANGQIRTLADLKVDTTSVFTGAATFTGGITGGGAAALVFNSTGAALFQIKAASGYADLALTPTGANTCYIEWGLAAGNTLTFYSDKTGAGVVGTISAVGGWNIGSGVTDPGAKNLNVEGSITTLKTITHSQAEIDLSYVYSAPLSADTITMSAGEQRAIINPAGTIALLTVTLPSTPTDGQIAGIAFTQIVTGLTVNAPGGATVVAPPTSAAVDSNFRFLYRSATTSWYPAP